MDRIAPTPPKFIHWNPNPLSRKANPFSSTYIPLYPSFLHPRTGKTMFPLPWLQLTAQRTAIPSWPAHLPRAPLDKVFSHGHRHEFFFFSQATSVLNHSPLPITNYSKFHKLNLIFLYFIPSDPHIVPLVAQWMALWHLTQETSSENLAQFTTCIFPDYAWNRMVLLTSWSVPATLQKQPRVLYLQ